MNTQPVTHPVTVAPSAFDQFLAAEAAAWDAYDYDLAGAKEALDAYRACNALAVAHAEYDDARVVTGDDGLDHYL